MSDESANMSWESERSSEEWWEEWRERIQNDTGSGYGEFWDMLQSREDHGHGGSSSGSGSHEEMGLKGGVALLAVLFFVVTTVLVVLLAVTCHKLKKLRKAGMEPTKLTNEASPYIGGSQEALPPKPDHTYIDVMPENPRDNLSPKSPPPEYQ